MYVWSVKVNERGKSVCEWVRGREGWGVYRVRVDTLFPEALASVRDLLRDLVGHLLRGVVHSDPPLLSYPNKLKLKSCKMHSYSSI